MLHHAQSSNQPLRPEEAQAVMQLWASRLSAQDAASAAPNVQDLAEAMGVSAAEVQLMLSEVRSHPVVDKKRRRRSFILAGVAIFAFWIFALAAVFELGKSEGRALNFYQFEPPVIASTAVAFPPSTADVVETVPANQLPEGVRLTFRDYTLLGSGSKSNPAQVEESAVQAIRSIMDRLAPQAGVNAAMRGRSAEASNLDRAGRAGVSSALLEGSQHPYLRWDPMRVESNGRTSIVMVPMDLSGDIEVQRLVRAEVENRIRIAANKVMLFVTNAK